ncbi:MAG TPA: tripartite tricarboxylate transporter TctB family protein [Clostridiales bacterium]|nr:tripartite tricarboxylate transporter TctB family protein [Clostridiales bacterium]
MKKTDIGVVGFMYGVCILFYVLSLDLKPEAQTYPQFIMLILAVLTTMYVIQMIVQAKRSGVSSGLEIFEGFLPKQFFVVLAMIIGYLILMYLVGFYISTVLLMVACLLFLRVPTWQIIISTLVIIGLIYGAFTLFLGVKLPVGLLFK